MPVLVGDAEEVGEVRGAEHAPFFGDDDCATATAEDETSITASRPDWCDELRPIPPFLRSSAGA